jgi:S1-C subfamily serine protease
VYNKDGLIITNYHVINPSITETNMVPDARRDNGRIALNVAFEDGTIYPVTLVGAGPFSDVAVIKVQDVDKD